jgi:hypothetical protein
MPKGHLMDSQVRQIEDAVRSSGLPVEDFKWMSRNGRWAGMHDEVLPALVYKPAGFFICFEHHEPFNDPYGFAHDPGGHQVQFRPGGEKPTEHRRRLGWPEVLKANWEWLQYVARERGLPSPGPPPSSTAEPFQKETSSTLRSLTGKLVVTPERDFLDEAIKCYEAKAYRAAIVMAWILTLDHLQEYILKHHLAQFDTALAKVKDKRVKVSKIAGKDEFSDIPESKFIEIARAAGIINNDVRKILDAKLGIRNSYAHPSNLSLPPVKAAEFITDLVDNVILKYPL